MSDNVRIAKGLLRKARVLMADDRVISKLDRISEGMENGIDRIKEDDSGEKFDELMSSLDELDEMIGDER